MKKYKNLNKKKTNFKKRYKIRNKILLINCSVLEKKLQTNKIWMKYNKRFKVLKILFIN